jgi:hypothetical protein
VGEVWKHHNLRVAYIAQHSMHHLEEHLDDSALEYITSRFKMGQDKELAKMQTLELTEEEVELAKKRGEICDVVGRQLRAKVLTYECVKTGRNKRDGTPDPVWLGRPELEKSYPAYVMKLVRNYDETLKAMSAGLDIRPLTYAVAHCTVSRVSLAARPRLCRLRAEAVAGAATRRSRRIWRSSASTKSSQAARSSACRAGKSRASCWLCVSLPPPSAIFQSALQLGMAPRGKSRAPIAATVACMASASGPRSACGDVEQAALDRA